MTTENFTVTAEDLALTVRCSNSDCNEPVAAVHMPAGVGRVRVRKCAKCGATTDIINTPTGYQVRRVE